MQSPNGFLELADGRRIDVEDDLTIGRIKGCGLILEDHKVSRRHARLVVEHGVVEIEDLGSSNGVRLNGNQVQRHILRPGDELRIGATELIYRRAEQPRTPPEVTSMPEPKPVDPEPGVEVIEFIDEVVKVRSRELPVPAASRRRSKPGRAGSADHGVLQFSKQQPKHGRLSDEVGQLGGLPKFLLILAILAASVGLAWLAWFLATI